MSTAKHTPGLLVRDTSGAPKPDVRAESGRAVAVTWMVCSSTPKTESGYQARQDEDRANADRIVAAWNACDGLSTEALEGGVVRELLEALQRADAFITNGIALGFIRMPDADTPDSAHQTPGVVRAAIAKATGGAA